MANPSDSLREYALRVAGRDQSWKQHGLCNKDRSRQAWFLALEDDTFKDHGRTINGYEAQMRVVADYCDQCPVQWECARWGVEVNEEVGVYALATRDRRWLTNQGDRALAIIDTARVNHVPVHVAVHRHRYPPKV